jgi:CRP/FNR family transcriptional regulator
VNDLSLQCYSCPHNVCARRVPLFANLNEEEIKSVVSIIRRKQYKKGETIIFEGSQIPGLLIINQGKAKAYVLTEDGKEQIIYLFYEGDFFGEKGLIKKHASSFTVEALEDVHICMISHRDFTTLTNKHKDINHKIMISLIDKIDKLENMLSSISNKGVEARLTSAILEFGQNYSNRHNQKMTDPFLLPLSREGIANYIGVTRETVSRKLNALSNDKIIELIGNKEIKILNLKKLRENL